ncbi:LysR family transcriptional regulator [Pseudomonas knackmussii B13]|uniref:LysR family transcriptional regulator n=1 Tax=Pseudomonas knackmussii (strain DSM 6978 / CCUG 54928 / LMG 23759 / B13) TaxID=1301098 RepID=A0A024HGU4_PSEKB|nr:LysR family transcriptional regulator [Pseudomonas knackmussii]CDF83658.1 LysR family transcriptional regulator [Pseudomonas knackmussii B13]
MDRFREMQVFDAVARAGSLAAGARLLALSTATVMRVVAALETRLGCELLLRGPRGVSLSDSGEAFAASCRQILLALAEAESSAAGLHAHPAGQLTVSVPLLMADQVFAPIALDYLAAFPEVRLRLQVHEEPPRLLEDGIDVALVIGHLPDSSGFALPVGQVTPVVCAAPDYLARHGRPTTLDALKAHQCIAVSAVHASSEWRFRQQEAARSVRLAPRLTCSTVQAAIRAATLGQGLARCLSHEAHQELRSGQLEALLQDFAGPALPAQLIYREGRRAAARVRTFLDFVVPRLRAHPALRG